MDIRKQSRNGDTGMDITPNWLELNHWKDCGAAVDVARNLTMSMQPWDDVMTQRRRGLPELGLLEVDRILSADSGYWRDLAARFVTMLMQALAPQVESPEKLKRRPKVAFNSNTH
ncbi:MAG: hypothetical protein JSR95_11945 [Proteobacteria bacterium]|nr:hypothetical protein [Pseudomonadota bacterium]